MSGYAAVWLFVFGVHAAYANIAKTVLAAGAILVIVILGSITIFNVSPGLEIAYVALQCFSAMILAIVFTRINRKQRLLTTSRYLPGPGTLFGLAVVCAATTYLIEYGILLRERLNVEGVETIPHFFFLQITTLHYLCTDPEKFQHRAIFWVVANLLFFIAGCLAIVQNPEDISNVTFFSGGIGFLLATGIPSILVTVCALLARFVLCRGGNDRAARIAFGTTIVQMENIFSVQFDNIENDICITSKSNPSY